MKLIMALALFLFCCFACNLQAQRRWGDSGCDDATPAVAGRVTSRLANGWYKAKDGWQEYYEKGKLIGSVHMQTTKYRDANGKEAEWPWCGCDNACNCKKGECSCKDGKKCCDECGCALPGKKADANDATDLPIGYNGGLDISGLGDKNSPSFQGDDRPISLPDYSKMPYITVFAKDGSQAKKIASELQSDGELAKAYNIGGYASSHFHAIGFALEKDAEFAKSGLAIYVQEPADEKGLGVVKNRVYGFSNAKDFAKKIDPNFDPNRKPEDPKKPEKPGGKRAVIPLPLIVGLAIVFVIWKRKKDQNGPIDD